MQVSFGDVVTVEGKNGVICGQSAINSHLFTVKLEDGKKIEADDEQIKFKCPHCQGEI